MDIFLMLSIAILNETLINVIKNVIKIKNINKNKVFSRKGISERGSGSRGENQEKIVMLLAESIRLHLNC